MASAVKNALGDTASLILKKTAEEVAKEAAEEAAKEAAEQAAKEAARTALKNTIKTATKNVINTTKDFVKNIGKTSSQFAKAAKNKILQSVGDAATSMKNFIKNNPGKVIGGLAVGTAAAVAYDKFLKLNNKSFTIKAIIPKKIGGVVGIGGKDVLYIEYIDPDKEKLRKHDIIVITDSDSVESSDGTYVILSANPDTPSIVVEKESDDTTPMPNLTKNGQAGTITYKTTFESQVGGLISDVGGDTVNTLDDYIKDIANDLGLGDYMIYIYIFIGFIIFVIVVGTIYKVYDMYRYSRSTNEIQHIITTSSVEKSTDSTAPVS